LEHKGLEVVEVALCGTDAGRELDDARQDDNGVKDIHTRANAGHKGQGSKPEYFDGKLEAENQGEE
jgi:hypothetical protein